MVEQYIEKAKQKTTHDKHGGYSKCYLFDDVALLYGFVELNTIDKKMEVMRQAKNDGIPLSLILEYKTDENSTIKTYDNGSSYQKCWTLQERAKGQEVHQYRPRMLQVKNDENAKENITENYRRIQEYYKNYINELDMLSDAPQEHFNEFLSNMIKISKTNLKIDPSKTTNFFYSKEEGFSFIDLSLDDRVVSHKEICNDFFFEIIGNPYSSDMPEELKPKAAEFGKNVLVKGMSACKENGLDPADVKYALDIRSSCLNLFDRVTPNFDEYLNNQMKLFVKTTNTLDKDGGWGEIDF